MGEGWRGRRGRHRRVGSRPLRLTRVSVVAVERVVVAKRPGRVGIGVCRQAPAGVVLSSVHVRSKRVSGEQGDIAGISVRGGNGVRRVRLRGRHVWRGQCRSGSGADSSGSRRRGRKHAVGLELLVGPVTSLRVGVVVYSRVTSQLIGAGEFLAASGELAGMGLLASVGSDVPSLML